MTTSGRGCRLRSGKLHEAPIYIDETGGLTPANLRARARRLARQYGGKLGLIVIDYIQLMSGNRQGENRATEVSEISRSIKSLAKELQVPIVALSQLSRKVEERTDKRPMMSDLRESGAIEQDADVILMMYREEYYKPDTPDKGIAEVIIGKQRNGPTGTVRWPSLANTRALRVWPAAVLSSSQLSAESSACRCAWH
jgi:replicative DNA helicase